MTVESPSKADKNFSTPAQNWNAELDKQDIFLYFKVLFYHDKLAAKHAKGLWAFFPFDECCKTIDGRRFSTFQVWLWFWETWSPLHINSEALLERVKKKKKNSDVKCLCVCLCVCPFNLNRPSETVREKDIKNAQTWSVYKCSIMCSFICICEVLAPFPSLAKWNKGDQQ